MTKPLGERKTMENRENLIKALREGNEEFRSLEKAHREYEEQLGQLEDKKYLTPEEEFEKARIKKLKLHGKDRMELIIRQFSESSSL